MPKRRITPAASPVVEGLEARVALSTTAGSAEVATEAVKRAATVTTLTASAGTLGQPITFSVTVRAPASAGAPAGTVDLIDHGQVVGTIAISAATSTDPKYDYSTGTATFSQPPGGAAYFTGKHNISAKFVPTSGTGFTTSRGSGSFTVAAPSFVSLSDGVGVDTVVAGTGAQIQAGQTASVLYTGYLAKNGKVFDDSSKDGGSPFSFTVGGDQVITGFDEGTAGMQVGETRAILIPAAEGYGSTRNGPIPANSTLIFLVTLESIS